MPDAAQLCLSCAIRSHRPNIRDQPGMQMLWQLFCRWLELGRQIASSNIHVGIRYAPMSYCWYPRLKSYPRRSRTETLTSESDLCAGRKWRRCHIDRALATGQMHGLPALPGARIALVADGFRAIFG